jgi:hypothetical protein
MAMVISADITAITAVAAGPVMVSLPNLMVAFGRSFGAGSAVFGVSVIYAPNSEFRFSAGLSPRPQQAAMHVFYYAIPYPEISAN